MTFFVLWMSLGIRLKLSAEEKFIWVTGLGECSSFRAKYFAFGEKENVRSLET